MPSREPGCTERMEKHAGLSARTKRQWEMVAAANGIDVPRKKKTPIDHELPLKKSGEPWTIKIAEGWAMTLRNLLERKPAHFHALVSLIEGHPEEVTNRQLRDLRSLGYLAPDRTPLPGAKAIIEAAYRQTPDGPVIVDPLDVKSAEDAKTYKRAEKQFEKLAEQAPRRILRRLMDMDKEDDKGPSV
jgi:hypothetical protein